MTDALLLDFDGTLVDSLPALQGAYFQFLRDFNIEGSINEFDEFNGPPLSQVVSELKLRYGLAGSDPSLYSKYLDSIEICSGEIRMTDGAMRLIATAQELGMQIAIVTSSPSGRVSEWLAANSLKSEFQCIVGAESTIKGKPHPDPYELALKKLKVSSGDAITVEDSLSGATASLNAEIRTVLLRAPQSTFEHPLLMLMDSLDDVTEYLHKEA